MLEFDETLLLRAALQIWGALAHTARMYRHLAAVMGNKPFEMEVSVDETETPPLAAGALLCRQRAGASGRKVGRLAPRYVGRFEKGVDYIGALDVFEAEFAQHAVIARALGPYKLSLHSGSDKFSIYPVAARLANGFDPFEDCRDPATWKRSEDCQVDAFLFRHRFSLWPMKVTRSIGQATMYLPVWTTCQKPDDLTDAELASAAPILFDGAANAARDLRIRGAGSSWGQLKAIPCAPMKGALRSHRGALHPHLERVRTR